MPALPSPSPSLAANTAPTFAVPTGTGKLVVPVGTANDEGQSVTLQPDGKIVVAGYSYNGSDHDFSLIRLNADGSLDTGFNGTGRLLVPVGGDSDAGFSVTVQADGKIVVAGTSAVGNDYDFSLIRLNADGSLDTSFSRDGKLVISMSEDSDAGRSVIVLPDGRIVMAGSSYNGVNYDFSLLRLNADGTLDNSFDRDGKLLVPVGSGDDYGWSATVQPDGKIVMAGFSDGVNGYDFSLIRLHADGSLDTSFSGDGKLMMPVGSALDQGKSVIVQPDGKIVVAGFSASGGTYDFSVIRLHADGTLDNTFNGNGKLLMPVGTGYDEGTSATLQPDGKIVVAGVSVNGFQNDFSLIRLNADGSLDSTFNGTGKLLMPVGSESDIGRSIVVQPDGKIVVAGSSLNGNNLGDFSLIRLNADGTLDTSFNAPANPVDTLGDTASYTENATLVVLDASVAVFDAELAARGHYDGASLSLARQGGASAQDLFGASGALSFTGSGHGEVELAGIVIGSYTQSDGSLAITFNTQATQARVNEALSALTYANTSDSPPASLILDWTFSDGNVGAQGSGGARVAVGNTLVHITPVNDPPTHSPVVLAPIAEDSGARTLTQAELLAEAFDPDGDTLIATDLILSSGEGHLVDNGDGTWTYTPAANDESEVRFDYTISDGSVFLAGSASLDITPVNDAPQLSDIPAGVREVLAGRPHALPDISVSDADGADVPLTLTLTASNGRVNGLVDADPTLEGIQLMGTAAQINAALAQATFRAHGPGAAAIAFSLSDGVAPAPTTGSYALWASRMEDPPSPPAPPPPPAPSAPPVPLATSQIDTAVYDAPRADYSLFPGAQGTWSIAYASGGPSASLAGIERLQFTDADLALDLGSTGLAQQAARLVFTLWGQSGLQDDALMGQAMAYVDRLGLAQVARVADELGLLDALAGGSAPAALLTLMHMQIAGRAPNTSELQALLDFQAAGAYSSAELLLIAAGLPLTAQAMDLSQLQQQGLSFEPFEGPLWGSPSADMFRAQPGNDRIDAGAGIDTVVYGGDAADYALLRSAQGGWTVQADLHDGGSDQLLGVERLQFADHALALDLEGSAGLAARLLGAALGENAIQDRALVGEVLAAVDVLGLQTVARLALDAGVLDALAGSPSMEGFIHLMYQHVAGQAPSEVEMQEALGLVQQEHWDRADLLVFVAELPQTAQLIGLDALAQQGLAYDPWMG